ncbi:MAG: hypothetical protein NZM10_06700 [Fimbriimonadales bacterium]|nr:hypothetical protein [Fimbriimonadales bacterium]
MRSVLKWGKLCLLLRVAAAQSEADRMQQVLSFREPAQRVQQVLQKLSQRTDVWLVAAPDLRDEIVLLDVEQLPLQQILNALAIALDAEWQLQSDGSYRLYRPLSKAQRRRALEREQWAHRWREELAKQAPERLDATLTEADAHPAFRRTCLRAWLSETARGAAARLGGKPAMATTRGFPG